MWVMIFYDLPMLTKRDQKAYSTFRKHVLKGGFSMYQYSFYVRYCASASNTQTHKSRVRKALPPKGRVSIMSLTDQQFEDIEHYIDGQPEQKPMTPPQQLELF